VIVLIISELQYYPRIRWKDTVGKSLKEMILLMISELQIYPGTRQNEILYGDVSIHIALSTDKILSP